ncbi:hypothetical protein N2152v2_007573 [Parachlorella kessleri]
MANPGHRVARPKIARPWCSIRASAAGPRGNTGASRRGSEGYRGKRQSGQGGRRPDCDSGRVQRGQQQPRREQVAFQGVFPQDPLVAIIGGGLSGLVCSIELAKKGVRSVVFDTGEHGVGGRLATRSLKDGSLPGADPSAAAAGAPLVFDHAAQYFTATDPDFCQLVEQWEADGAVREWRGRVGHLRIGGSFTALDDSQPRFIAAGGMRSLAQYLAGRATRALGQARENHRTESGSGTISGMVEVRRPQWVSDLIPVLDESAWRLMGKGRDQGLFDAVVIAHNGKCANRLTEPAGIPQVHGQLRRLKNSANWALMVAFARPVPLLEPFEGAFVHDSSVLSWTANNTAKLGLRAESGGVECWTLLSTQEYGRSNKVPQESIPPEVRQRVTADMLEDFARCLGLPGATALPPVIYSRAQLWGAALPQTSPGVPCIWDPQGRVGVCGDWVAGGGSMQARPLAAAAMSGKALAERIAGMRGLMPSETSHLAAGLTDPVRPIRGMDIGQFPSRSDASGGTAKRSIARQLAGAG